MKKLIILAAMGLGVITFTGCADREPVTSTTTTEETSVHRRPAVEATTTTETTHAVQPAGY